MNASSPKSLVKSKAAPYSHILIPISSPNESEISKKAIMPALKATEKLTRGVCEWPIFCHLNEIPSLFHLYPPPFQKGTGVRGGEGGGIKRTATAHAFLQKNANEGTTLEYLGGKRLLPW
ncbi:hypothetical protein CEXT_615121 [Caerostris extrusa]|uniref:Uncharacterized protein n=1 Tax=Caerostris extrusa TaxID=172846 RepID=A0AAV4PMC4_CAEEX|nr:hypothetical protein CEXT_615121 [Caerostris extrusa]